MKKKYSELKKANESVITLCDIIPTGFIMWQYVNISDQAHNYQDI